MDDVLDWDGEYRAGKWDALGADQEHMRYAILAACLAGADHGPRMRVLDLGCGPGILRAHLPDGRVDRYTGVDVSAEAIRQAELQAYERSDFFVASLDAWEPDEDYDAIVFNEVLYYLAQPVAIVERVLPCLRAGGSVFVSMWYPPIAVSIRSAGRGNNVRARLHYRSIWRALSRRLDVVDDILVRRGGRRQWRIQRLELDPKAQGAKRVTPR